MGQKETPTAIMLLESHPGAEVYNKWGRIYLRFYNNLLFFVSIRLLVYTAT